MERREAEARVCQQNPGRQLFCRAEHDDLIIVHNMGQGFRYCTMRADGFKPIWRTARLLQSDWEPQSKHQIKLAR
jgi:hypothetical protein